MKVKTENGSELPNLNRQSSGGLVVNNKDAYERYQKEKRALIEMNDLKTRLNKAEMDIKYILERISKNG